MAKELSKEQQVTHLSNRIKSLEHKIEDMTHARERETEQAEQQNKLNKENTQKFAKEHPEQYSKILELVKITVLKSS